MTTITPDIQQVNPPSLVELLQSHKREIMKAINCVKIGVIQSFNAATQEATVQVAQQQVTSISTIGVRTIAEYPLLLNVPVVFPAGGGFTLTFPIGAGDECLVLFNDREIDNWLTSGPGLAPTTGRVHDLSDGFALVGVRSNPRALAGVSTNSTQLRSDDGQTFVEVGSGKIQLIADTVVLHGRNKLTFDAGGTGIDYTPSLITSYTTGVPTASNPPDPPGPIP